MLLCDFGNLAEETKKLEEADLKVLHLDVMDGHFVPNMTYGLPIVEAFKKLTDLPLDVHLMISNPEDYIEKYVEAGADIVTIHVEACKEPEKLLQQIKDLGAVQELHLTQIPLYRLLRIVLIFAIWC